MPKYAIVFDGVVREEKEFPSQPPCKYVDGQPTVRLIVEPTLGLNQVYDGYIVRAQEVERAVRTKSATEIQNDRRDKILQRLVDNYIDLVIALYQKGVLDGTEPKLQDVYDYIQGQQ